MKAGYDGELGQFYIVVYPEENGAGLGNKGYRLKGGLRGKGIVILTKPRINQEAVIWECNNRFMDEYDKFIAEHRAWLREMYKWLDSIDRKNSEVGMI